MASRPESYRPIEAHGTLHLDTPGGGSLDLVANGEELRLALPDLREALAVMPRSLRGRRRALHFFASLLATHGLALSVEAAGRPVLRVGHRVTPSWLARLLGLAPAFIPLSAIGLLLRRR
jgi:hypothetical protein